LLLTRVKGSVKVVEGMWGGQEVVGLLMDVGLEKQAGFYILRI
jgi:hypothetical protein